MTVTKRHIVEQVYSRIVGHMGITKNECVRLVESVFQIIKDSLSRGESVKISNFGKFQVKTRKEKRGRNPQTGEIALIPARKRVVFQYSTKLKNRMNTPLLPNIRNNYTIPTKKKKQAFTAFTSLPLSRNKFQAVSVRHRPH